MVWRIVHRKSHPSIILLIWSGFLWTIREYISPVWLHSRLNSLRLTQHVIAPVYMGRYLIFAPPGHINNGSVTSIKLYPVKRVWFFFKHHMRHLNIKGRGVYLLGSSFYSEWEELNHGWGFKWASAGILIIMSYSPMHLLFTKTSNQKKCAPSCLAWQRRDTWELYTKCRRSRN